MLTKKSKEALLGKAKELGASGGKFIRIKDIPVGAWTRMKCQYGCPNFGKTLCCPPYTPDYAATQDFLQGYKHALLLQYKYEFKAEEANNWVEVDKNLSNELLQLLLAVEKEAFLANYYKAFALKAGRCHLCETCTLTYCRHPQEARPSMEACGIDVMAVVNKAGFKAQILKGPVRELAIYGLVLIE